NDKGDKGPDKSLKLQGNRKRLFWGDLARGAPGRNHGGYKGRQTQQQQLVNQWTFYKADSASCPVSDTSVFMRTRRAAFVPGGCLRYFPDSLTKLNRASPAPTTMYCMPSSS